MGVDKIAPTFARRTKKRSAIKALIISTGQFVLCLFTSPPLPDIRM